MTDHTVLVANKIAATNIDSLVRPVISSSALDNGMVFNLLAKDTVSTNGEVWVATIPATGSLVELWMAMEPELPFATAGTKVYNGLGTVKDFYTAASTVLTAFKPVKGDIITVTSEAFVSGTVPTAGQYAYAVDSSWLLTAGASPAADALSFRYLGTQKIPMADGSIGSQYITGYQLECLFNEED